MNILKFNNHSFNVEAFRGMNKTEFIKCGYAGTLNPEIVWDALQKELDSKEVINEQVSDVPKTNRRSRKNKKGN